MKENQNRLSLKALIRSFCMIVLLALPVAIMFWIWEDARRTPPYVLNGSLFQSSWHIAHAGFCMDQPTIGKWYFWSTVFGGIWALCAFAASRICPSCLRISRILFSLLCVLTVFILLNIHTVPFFWTLQYINEMGFTHRRLIALAWGIIGYLVLLSLTGTFIRQLLKKQIELTLAGDGLKNTPEK